jgi:STE24 endopeptidase
LDEALLLLPLLGPLLLSWAAYYEVDRWLRRREVDGENDASRPESDSTAAPRVWTRGEYVAYQSRTHLMLVLAPLVPLVATQDVLQLAAPELMAGKSAWLALLPPLAAVVIGFPWLLRRMWKAAPLPAGPLRCLLEQSAHRWGLRVRDIMVWNTERMVVNAAVAGFVPGWRYVFLSDALIEHFSPSEMEAVFGHEVGHIRHRHLLLRALVLLAPLSALSLVHVAWPQGFDGWQPSTFAWIGPTALSGLAVVTVAGLYVAAVFGYCSRRFERQADLFGCRIASTADGAGSAANLTPHGVRTFIGALEKLAVLNGISRDARSWQHDSIAHRVAFLEQVATDPLGEVRCHRQVRLLGGLAVAVVAAGLVLPILTG